MTGVALLWEAAPKALCMPRCCRRSAPGRALGAAAERSRACSGAAARARVERLLGRIGLGAALVVLLATALRAWTHTVAAFGFADAQSWEAIRIIAFESRWGSGWVLQLAAATVLLASYLVVQVTPA